MFGNLFRKKSIDTRLVIVAELAARLQPFQRGEFFEDPLDVALKANGIGEVIGGGSTIAPDPVGISSCDIEISGRDGSEATITEVMKLLENLGAPKSSKLHVPGKSSPIAFGKLEGMAIFLNGRDLPAETYAQSDVNKTISGLSNVLSGVGESRGYWEGSKETALYFYGSDYLTMKATVTPYLSNDPLCAMSRIEQIA